MRDHLGLLGGKVAEKDILLIGQLGIHTHRYLPFVRRYRAIGLISAAGILRCRQKGRKLTGHGRKRRRWKLVGLATNRRERRPQSTRRALARCGSEHTKVARQHRRCGHKRGRRRGCLAHGCALISGENENSILDHWAANHAAELVALQIVRDRRKIIARIHCPIAQEFERISVEGIGAGLGHRIHLRTGMRSSLRILRAGVYFKLLQCIGKRQGHIGGVIQIQVRRAIKRIIDAEVQAACHRDANTRVHAESW